MFRLRRATLGLLLLLTSSVHYGQIIADHNSVLEFDEIPQQYIDSVKTMLVSIPGESHSEAYRLGQILLEQMDGTYQVETYIGSTPPATDQNLRMGMHRYGGEYLFFSESRIEELKGEITDQYNTGNPFHVMGFGWCYDMTKDNDPGGIEDTVFQVRWAGRSEEGPDGNMRWGLDKGDSALTLNRVSMDTYLEAVETWILHCEENSYPTRWIFTTGPVDYYYHAGTENGFQREIKHDYIRDYVAADTSRILFDYADILCWSNQGEQNLVVWHDDDSLRPHAQIHPDNMMDYNSSWNPVPHVEDGDHIGEVGTVRLAKAMWWMLAKLKGWRNVVLVTDVSLAAEGNSALIASDGGSLQMYAEITPIEATDTTLSWSLIPGTGMATIDTMGLVTALSNGTVTARATANDGSGVYGELLITITNQVVPVISIEVRGEGGSSLIASEGGTLQLQAMLLPVDATDTTVSWSLLPGTGTATIDSTGLVTALSDGMVTARATANDSSGIFGELVISINDHFIPVAEIALTGAGGASAIPENGGTLQLQAMILPVDATDTTVTWLLIPGTGMATIDSTGLLTALSNGTVTARATANDSSGVYGELMISINDHFIPVAEIALTGAGGASAIPENGGTLQLQAMILPVDATDTTVSWSLIPGTGMATIDSTGLLTALSNGTVTARATANDSSGVYGELMIAIGEKDTLNIWTDPSNPSEIFDMITTIGYRIAMPVAMPESGDIISVTIYHQGGSGDLLLGVYGDDSGLPGSLLGVTPPTPISSSAGWQTVYLNIPVGLEAGETAWLAWVFESNPGVSLQSGTPGRAASSQTWSSGMPASFGSSSQRNYIYSIYASYTSEGAVGTVPDAPSDLQATGLSANSITLEWSDNSNDETGFELERSDTPGSGYVQIHSAGVNAITYMDASVEPENDYYFRVRSVNSYGGSDYSPELSVSTPALPPGGETVGHEDVYGLVTTIGYRLAMPVTMPESGDIISVTIYHQGGSGDLLLGVYGDDSGLPGSLLGVTPPTPISSSEGWQTVYLNSPISLEAGETAWLAWVFENNPGVSLQSGTPGRAASSQTWSSGMPAGFGSSSQSNYIYSIYASCTSEGAAGTVPDAPSDLQATDLFANSITLEWSDNSNDETGFELERSDTPGSGYVQIHSAGVNATTYMDASVEPENNYYFRVRSVNSYGESDYSQELSVSTPALPPGGETVGHEDVYGLVTTVTYRLAMPVTMPESGDIQSVTIYHQGGSGGLLLGVYGDDSGLPGSLLGVTPPTPISSAEGWQTVYLNSPVSLEAGETAWLAWVFESNPGVRLQSGTPGRAASSQAWRRGMPASFGSSSQSNYIYSIYASYTNTLPSVQAMSMPLGFEEESNKEEVFSVFPNPTSGELNINWAGVYADGLILRVYKISGEMIEQREIEPHRQSIQIDLSDFSDGIYFLVLIDAQKKVAVNRSRVIKLR